MSFFGILCRAWDLLDLYPEPWVEPRGLSRRLRTVARVGRVSAWSAACHILKRNSVLMVKEAEDVARSNPCSEAGLTLEGRKGVEWFCPLSNMPLKMHLDFSQLFAAYFKMSEG